MPHPTGMSSCRAGQERDRCPTALQPPAPDAPKRRDSQELDRRSQRSAMWIGLRQPRNFSEITGDSSRQKEDSPLARAAHRHVNETTQAVVVPWRLIFAEFPDCQTDVHLLALDLVEIHHAYWRFDARQLIDRRSCPTTRRDLP